jgi:hypothetical protein
MSGITLQPPAPAIRIPELRSGMKLVGIQRDEFLFPSSSVTVEMPTAMDAEAAQRAIGVAREDNAVKVGSQGKKARGRRRMRSLPAATSSRSARCSQSRATRSPPR